MKLSNFFLLGSFGVTQGQDMGGSLGLQFDTVWPVLMNMANIPKDALFWPYLLCGQKMCPMLLYSMIKVNKITSKNLRTAQTVHFDFENFQNFISG